MFTYEHESIINDPSVILTADTTANELVIKRVANIKGASIVDGIVYMTAPVVGAKDKKKVAFAAPVATADVKRLLINVTTPSKELFEFRTPNWGEFSKSIIIESAATTAADFVKTCNLALGEGAPVTITLDGTDIVVEAAEDFIMIDELIYADVTFPTCTDCNPSAETVGDAATVTTVTEGKPSFGTGKWLIENLRFPTQLNRRYNALFEDELPVASASYTQFVFEVETKKAAPGGLSAVGQVVPSITSQVIYAQGLDTDATSAAGVLKAQLTALKKADGATAIQCKADATHGATVNTDTSGSGAHKA